MTLEIHIDRDVCMGSGNCVYQAPGVFDLDADGIACVVDVTAALAESVLRAAKQCPTGAITVQERA